MESVTPLGQAFPALASVLTGLDCVAVWPATTAGLVGEFQVLTEKEWQRLLRVGLHISSDANVRELYCFQNVPGYDGLMVRVLRLIQKFHPRMRQNEGQLRVWTVQKTPAVEGRVEVDQIKTERGGNESSRSDSNARDSPPRLGSDSIKWTISPEVQRKRRRNFDSVGSVASLKSTNDEVRPPTKTRRLGVKRKERDAPVVPLPDSHDIVGNTARSRRSGQSDTARKHRDPSVHEAVRARSVAVAGSLGSVFEILQYESDTASDTLSGVQSGEEEKCSRVSSATRGINRYNRTEGDTLVSAFQKVVAAGMCIDDEDDFETKRCTSHDQVKVVTRSTSGTNLFWSALEGATTRALKLLNNGLFSVVEVVTAQDSSDYDLLWIEEDSDQRWTMFGEPSSSV
ncbi:hypothetical protein JG688_00001602 [Phytophthora aleatoria]|uniref:Uncharacterized protein n=1 Tax=Phytophthora aleatoria TaxID=2496075 RepID=A0A8J5IVR3_9STRA|nr:hypothetical protein JG688_00001602 [Phytophthora aleatoria]